jgi:hypothetical protein
MSKPLQRSVVALVIIAAALVMAGAWQLALERPGDHGAPEFRAVLLLGGAAVVVIALGLVLIRLVSANHRRRQVDPLVPTPNVIVPTVSMLIDRPAATGSDVLRAYDVRVDRTTVARLKLGEFVVVPVPAGKHRVSVGLAEYQSEPLSFIGLAGDHVAFAVEPTPGTPAQRRLTNWVQITRIDDSADRLRSGDQPACATTE